MDRIVEGSGRELSVDQLGELAQDPIQLGHLAIPDAEDVIGEVFLVVEFDGALGFLLHFAGEFDLAFAAFVERELANGDGEVRVALGVVGIELHGGSGQLLGFDAALLLFGPNPSKACSYRSERAGEFPGGFVIVG